MWPKMPRWMLQREQPQLCGKKSGGRYVTAGVEHTKVGWRLRGRLMSSFSTAQAKTSCGACEAGTAISSRPNYLRSQYSVDLQTTERYRGPAACRTPDLIHNKWWSGTVAEARIRTAFLFYFWCRHRRDMVRIRRCDGQRQKAFPADGGLRCGRDQRRTKLDS